MKKLLSVFAFTGLLFAVQPVESAQAQGEPPGKLCSAAGDLGVSHDACVTFVTSILNNGGANAANALCKILADTGNLPLGFKNHGQCVKFLKILLG